MHATCTTYVQNVQTDRTLLPFGPAIPGLPLCPCRPCKKKEQDKDRNKIGGEESKYDEITVGKASSGVHGEDVF